MEIADNSGTLLQLPYDLILPHARQLARQKAANRSTFTINEVYRDVGGQPKASLEADFDIVDDKNDDDDTARNDAEAMKVVDEALTELPQFITTEAKFYLSHGLLIDAILDACRVPLQKQLSVKNALELVGYQSTMRGASSWDKVGKELLNMQLMGTTIDALKKYDLEAPPNEAFEQLSGLMASAAPHVQTRCNTAIDELRRIVQGTKQLEVHRKVLVSPLSCHNARFYANGFIFTAAIPATNGKLPLASGGRYNSLIEAQYSPDPTLKQGAVGVQIGVDPIVKLINSGTGKRSDYKGPKLNPQLPKRCDVLMVTDSTKDVRKVALGLLSQLWASDIKAELARARESYDMQEYSIIVKFRHDFLTKVRVTNTTTQETFEVTSYAVVNVIHRELGGKRKAR